MSIDNEAYRVGFSEHYEEGTPVWDIGRPQPPFIEIADQVAGPVLDIGCEGFLHRCGAGKYSHPPVSRPGSICLGTTSLTSNLPGLAGKVNQGQRVANFLPGR